MGNPLMQIIHTAVIRWAQQTYRTNDIVITDVSPDEDEPERYLVVLAARSLTGWLVTEVWLNDGQVEAINDLGEGLPLVEQEWPWGEDSG
jgi:hypothetical protein